MNTRFLRFLGFLGFLAFGPGSAGSGASGSQDVLTTSFESAMVDVAYLDAVPDPVFTPLDSLERDADGAFTLAPGAYAAAFESYCLLPGTHGPTAGDGYLAAPLQGPGSDLVLAILDRSRLHPSIPQEDIQQLLWALLSRAPYSLLDDDIKAAATTLLTADELRAVERLSGESLTDRLRGAILSRAPEPVQRMLQAQERLRSLLADASATYEEMREAAVLDGEPEPQAGDRDVPASRWSYHSGGYFIRLASSDFTRTRVEIVVPHDARPSIARDGRGRIVRAAYPGGLVVEAAYDESIPALVDPAFPDVTGYAFSTLRFSNGGETAEIRDTGWTFVSRTGAPEVASEDEDAPAHGPRARQEGWKQRYDDAKGRYERFKELQKARDEQRKRDARERGGPSEGDVADVTDEGHYRDGYDAATKGEASDKASWIEEQLRRTTNAFEYVHCRLTGGCEPQDDPKKTPRQRKYRPSRDAGVPGAQGGQRLGVGARFSGAR